MESKVGGGGEIRRVHIIYFLSRMGRVEHPHLIRVHHSSKNGVHLRGNSTFHLLLQSSFLFILANFDSVLVFVTGIEDVKRWLSELRGKDMPDAFAWSYKRRYKTGYVWQDLLDDDLISPISDNEYVIKGSEITTLSFDPCFRGEKKGSTLTKPETITSIEETKSKNPGTKSNGESQVDGEDSGPLDSETSTESSESIKERNSDDDHQKQRSIIPITKIKELNDETENSRKNEKNEIVEKQNPSSSSSSTSTARSSSSSSSSSSFNKSKSYSSGGATNVFRSLLSCRATDINDSALMMIHRSSCSSSSEICKFENLSGSDTTTSGTLWNQHQSRLSISKPSSSSSENSTSKKSNEFGANNQKKVSAAFKPVAEPHCSQCGKGFKPERLHSHMKSCRGLKSLSKNRNSATAGYDFETEQKFTTFGFFKERNQQGCF
ncbi:hypothetical protein MKW92_031428 [Papaver armeniacum]|nr:hypothetical protein MKW92_031428 [Papaver armeniacum]